jgi:hypothetical protein
MPRYFFHLRYGSEVIRDEHGDELANDHMAMERAVNAARTLLRAPDARQTWSDCVLEVTNDKGEAVWRMPLVNSAAMAGE